MIRLFVLMPIVMCVIWWWYLNMKGYTAKDGLKGYLYIFAFNAVIAAFFFVLMILTR